MKANLMKYCVLVKNHNARDNYMDVDILNFTLHNILIFIFKQKQNRKIMVLAKVLRVD